MEQFVRKIGLIAAAMMLPGIVSVQAATIDVTYVGTWDSTGAGNPTGVGGPGMSAGQRFVIRASYDDASARTDNVDVLDAFFSPSGNLMTTINLDDAGNSLDIFVPMEGLDSGSPFIYTQDEGDHFPAFIVNPTLNFANLAPLSNANILGLEYEGDFVAGGGGNFIELFNTSPGGGAINMVSQILNFDAGFAPAVVGVNTLAEASDVIVDAGPDRVYSASSLMQTTAATIVQSNDLGAARSDGEDFITTTWSQAGVASGDDITVAIADSGLTNTIDSAIWTFTADEEMTGRSGSDALIASYLNAAPTASASAVANAGGYDFSYLAGDDDLAVNGLIAGFEVLVFSALLDGTLDVTAFFNSLLTGGGHSPRPTPL